MNAAAIGLIGVIVGALLAGATSLILDRGRRHAKARMAGQLIVVELGTAGEKLRSAIKAGETSSDVGNGSSATSSARMPPAAQTPASPPDGPQSTPKASEPLVMVDADGWWIGDLPTDAWKKHQSDLATDVRPGVLEMVARAYSLCVVLNEEHAEARTSPARPRGDLDNYAQTLELARVQLAGESRIRNRVARQRIARWSPALAITTAVVVLAVIALFVPRVDVDSKSVTTAVQSRLGSNMLVQCSQTAHNWDCTAYPQSWSSSCPAPGRAFVTESSFTDYVSTKPSPAAPSTSPASSACKSMLRPVDFTADVNGQEITAAVIEQSGHADRVRELAAGLAKSSALQRFWRSIFG